MNSRSSALLDRAKLAARRDRRESHVVLGTTVRLILAHCPFLPIKVGTIGVLVAFADVLYTRINDILLVDSLVARSSIWADGGEVDGGPFATGSVRTCEWRKLRR